MGSGMSEINCPKCDYERAIGSASTNGGYYYTQCYRCGYLLEEILDRKKSKFPDDVVWNIEETGGNGSFVTRAKGESGSTIGKLSEEAKQYLEANLDKYDLCKYAFEQNSKWYVQDLLTGTTKPYDSDSFMQN